MSSYDSMASISVTVKDTWKSCSRLRQRLMWVRESHDSMVSIAVPPSMASGFRSSPSAMICLIRSSIAWLLGCRDVRDDLHPLRVANAPRREVELPRGLVTFTAGLLLEAVPLVEVPGRGILARGDDEAPDSSRAALGRMFAHMREHRRLDRAPDDPAAQQERVDLHLVARGPRHHDADDAVVAKPVAYL